MMVQKCNLDFINLFYAFQKKKNNVWLVHEYGKEINVWMLSIQLHHHLMSKKHLLDKI